MLAGPEGVSNDGIVERTMLNLGPSAYRRHLKAMAERGWIIETKRFRLFYRVDQGVIERDLSTLGYELPAYPDPDIRRVRRASDADP